MAPNGRSTTRAKRRRTKTTKPRRAQDKKKQKLEQKPTVNNVHELKTSSSSSSSMEDMPSSTSCTSTTTATTTSSSDKFSKTDHDGFDNFEATVDNNNNISTSGCSTPKGQRFRISEIVTCPPAPKKQRVVSNCSLRRTPIAFFAPPDLELFFFFALRDISV